MKKLLLGLLFLGGTANAATPPYGGTQISTTTGKATQYLPGVLSVSASSTTVSTPKIILDGASGSVAGASATFTYGVNAATIAATGLVNVGNLTESGSNTLTNDISGVAATATALAADPSDCSLPNVALGINTAGTAQCAQPSNVTGNAATATALAANGGNCLAGNFPLGVDASGAIESCTDAATQAELDTHAALTGTSAHSAASANTVSAIVARDGSGNFSAGTITASLTGAVSGNATTATALAANGANCSAGSYALGVDASGAAEGCTVAATGSGDVVTTATQTLSGLTTISKIAVSSYVSVGAQSSFLEMNANTGSGINNSGMAFWARSNDGAAQSSGCVVAVWIENPASASDVLVFTSTTSIDGTVHQADVQMGVTLEASTPGSFSRVGLAGIYRVLVGETLGTNDQIDFSATRCQAGAAGAYTAGSFGRKLGIAGHSIGDHVWIKPF